MPTCRRCGEVRSGKSSCKASPICVQAHRERLNDRAAKRASTRHLTEARRRYSAYPKILPAVEKWLRRQVSKDYVYTECKILKIPRKYAQQLMYELFQLEAKNGGK